jgi:hypothetical protein
MKEYVLANQILHWARKKVKRMAPTRRSWPQMARVRRERMAEEVIVPAASATGGMEGTCVSNVVRTVGVLEGRVIMSGLGDLGDLDKSNKWGMFHCQLPLATQTTF